MNHNRKVLPALVIYLGIFLAFFPACGSHEEDHNHDIELHKHDEHTKEEIDHHGKHNNANHDKKESAHDDHDNAQKEIKHDGHDHKKREENPQKAVTKADEKKGIQLLPAAAKTIGLKKLPLKRFNIKGSRAYRLPPHLLIRHEMNRSCYLKRGDWYIQKKVRIIKTEKGQAHIIIPGSKNSDEIITAGVPLLHLSWLEAFGASGHGHGH